MVETTSREQMCTRPGVLLHRSAARASPPASACPNCSPGASSHSSISQADPVSNNVLGNLATILKH